MEPRCTNLVSIILGKVPLYGLLTMVRAIETPLSAK